MSDPELLFEIVDTLETADSNRDECQLYQVIDIKVLEQLVNPAGPHARLEIGFSTAEFRLCVTQSSMQVLRSE
ncbi:hypothetical protein ACT4ML_15500 [Natrinema sp. LN54]|uniref:hypothetical protein n=1 Tax=Natrinema sp. LN54 TaxID=3458705 RepID=UPI0040375E8A